MTMNTKYVFALTLGCIALLPLRVFADPPSSSSLYRSLESGAATLRPAANLRGTIESIDYASGMIVVRSGDRTTPVAIVPNTTIYGHDGYAGFSDLRRGQNVEISVYEVDGRLVAKSVRLK